MNCLGRNQLGNVVTRPYWARVIVRSSPLVSLFLFTFLSPIVGLNDCWAQPSTGESVDKPVEIKLPHEQVLVEINNPSGHEYELLALQDIVRLQSGLQTQRRLVHQDTREQVTFRLDAGKYFVVDKTNKATFAVPALLVGNKKALQITIGSKQQLEDEFALVLGGPSLIGDETGVGQNDERPSIEHVKSFWLGRYEVTNQKYVEFLNARGRCDEAWLDMGSRKCRIKPGQANRFNTSAPKEPVVMVSLAGAEAYCLWLTETTGKNHRLPTGIEWEKAARGSRSTVYSYGNRYLESMANQQSGTIMKVGSFAQSDEGLFDMTGNVFEWVGNKYDSKQPGGPMNQELRGGSFVLDGLYLRNSFRMRQSPTVMTDDIGFRVLREVESIETTGLSNCEKSSNEDGRIKVLVLI